MKKYAYAIILYLCLFGVFIVSMFVVGLIFKVVSVMFV